LVRAARTIAYMTPEEAQLVQDLHGPTAGAVVGSGVDPAPLGDAGRARRRQQLPRRFALYLGRVDASKGLPQLIRAHKGYRRGGGRLGLVLAGRRAGRMRLPRWAVATGFLTEQERADLLAAADVVVLPSPYESLSLVALEAWAAGIPTLANMRSAVLAGQTARSGGGLLYDSERYVRQLTRLASDDDLRTMLSQRGRAFSAAQSWDEVARGWRRLLASVRQPVGSDSSSSSVASMSIRRPSRQVPSGARS
jgi:glycosyltransferase involved in cell wall biosynthesis